MLKHFLKISIRSLIKNKINSFINIGGLSIAMASAFLILLYVLHETSYDKYHKNRDYIYRILIDLGPFILESTPYNLGPTLKNEFPEIIHAARIMKFGTYAGGQYVKHNNQYIRESAFKLTDNELFKIFSLNIF